MCSSNHAIKEKDVAAGDVLERNTEQVGAETNSIIDKSLKMAEYKNFPLPTSLAED